MLCLCVCLTQNFQREDNVIYCLIKLVSLLVLKILTQNVNVLTIKLNKIHFSINMSLPSTSNQIWMISLFIMIVGI